MTSVDEPVITSKLRDIIGYLKELEPLLKFEPAEIVADYLKLRVLERNFQLIVDSMIDINTHIITRKNLAPPDDYQSTFEILGQAGVLPIAFALKVAPVVGLRNKIVHQYGQIDRKKFVDDLKAGVRDFEQFGEHIKKFLASAKGK